MMVGIIGIIPNIVGCFIPVWRGPLWVCSSSELCGYIYHDSCRGYIKYHILWYTPIYIYIHIRYILVGGLEHFLFFHIWVETTNRCIVTFGIYSHAKYIKYPWVNPKCTISASRKSTASPDRRDTGIQGFLSLHRFGAPVPKDDTDGPTKSVR